MAHVKKRRKKNLTSFKQLLRYYFLPPHLFFILLFFLLTVCVCRIGAFGIFFDPLPRDTIQYSRKENHPPCRTAARSINAL